MRYSSTIRNQKALDWNLSLQEAYLFSWMYELPSWADKVVIGNDVYFFASKGKAIEEMPLLTDKPDTMYRYYKSLESKGLITIKKIDNKDYISLTEKAQQWNFQSDHSEKNPNELGKKSEHYSEKNPTYNNISINKENKNKTTTIKEVVDVPDFVKKEKEEFKQQALDYQKESNRLDAEQTKDLIRNNSSLKEELIKFFTRTTLYKQADKQAHDKVRLNIRLREFFEVVLDEHITRNKSEELYPRKSSESIKHFRNYFKKKIDNLPEKEERYYLKLLIS